MSGEEDTELRDLVAQTLENNGVLCKIRAELRASVFLALEEHESTQSKHPFQNKRLKEYLQTAEGVMAASLVKEFLEFFKLDFTVSVFEPESYCGTEFYPSSRDELAKQLGVQENNDTAKSPILSFFLKQSMHPDNLNDSRDSANKKYMTEPIVNGKDSSEFVKPVYLNEEMVLPLDKSFVSPEKMSQSLLKSPPSTRAAVPVTDEETSINNLTRTLESLDATSTKNLTNCPKAPNSSPLGSLPPLIGSLPPCSANKELDQIKAIIELASPSDSLDNYEEDFQSSVSGSQPEQRASGCAASGSEEIEEDVASEAPSSGSVQVEELTLDESLLLPASFLADHLESV